ncbi:unnamed protein product [Porites lobata]|uniref:Uncharacterized protein n=1 Tax=Porites lobata TaxID=104759 RepID=A0ABN8NVU0_9CNID|nr:unnamed protein product [Porites lobata]
MGSHWKPGVVTEHAETPRSYRIRTDEGREYRRNRRALIKSPETNEHSTSKEAANQAIPSVEEPISTSQEQGEMYSSEEEISEPLKTASGRTVRRPLRFKDYVM